MAASVTEPPRVRCRRSQRPAGDLKKFLYTAHMFSILFERYTLDIICIGAHLGRDSKTSRDAVSAADEVYIFQALSGG
jgi:hypothetical protein